MNLKMLKASRMWETKVINTVSAFSAHEVEKSLLMI